MPRLCLRRRSVGSLLRLKKGTRDAAGNWACIPGQPAVSPETVRELVDAQFPSRRALAIKPVDSQGTVNTIFRIGSQFAARIALEPGDPGGGAAAAGVRGESSPRGGGSHAVPPRPSRWRRANPGRLPASKGNRPGMARRNGYGRS